MLVAKLSTDKIVRVLKGPQSVKFADGDHVLICDYFGSNRSRIHPYWVIATLVVWVMDI